MASFNWVHLSDLHMGMSGQAPLWPMFKHELYADLRRMFSKTGPWDAVFFTGDLTQKGTIAEFAQLNKALNELWVKFAELGCSPVLIPVPGNHDLQRPDRKAPGSLLLKQWWQLTEVREEFWENPASAYQKTIDSAFSEYTRWVETLDGPMKVPRGVRSPAVPGDFSATLTSAIGPVGIVGLNSAWLQLDDGNYEGLLAVDSRQLHAVTNADPVAWTRQHEFNLILTHHPTSWLHAQSAWQAEINPSGALFDLHMFGHMHEHDTTSISRGGGGVVRSVQAASMFGLEKYGNSLDRRHGYSLGRVDGAGEVRIWPRRAELTKDGSRRLVPDHSQILDDDESFSLPPKHVQGIGHNAYVSHSQPAVALLNSDSQVSQILEKARYFLTRSPESKNVRNVEQTLCKSALSADRICWIEAEWGSGFEGFTSTLIDSEVSISATYRLSLSDYTNKEEFFASIKGTFGVSFERLCDALSVVGPSHLILEDIPQFRNVDGISVNIGPEIEELVSIIKQYCPDLRMLLHTRQLPDQRNYAAVLLKPLDEADLRAYVADHPNGGAALTSQDKLGALFWHTDGMPARVDTTLRDLRIIPIEQLASVNQDLRKSVPGRGAIPAGVAKAVEDMAGQSDPVKQRAYELLKALSAFPQGETLERVRRFNDKAPFYADNARELMDRSLISPSVVSGQTLGDDQPAKILVVPRPVRDFVRSSISKDEALVQTKRAAALYFGPKWAEGKMQQSLSERLRRPTASAAELANASTIVVRLINDAEDRGDSRAKTAAWRIAAAYIKEMTSGDHYRNVVSTCDYILGEAKESNDVREIAIRASQGACLRMLGRRQRAIEVLEPLVNIAQTKSAKQEILLDLALANQALRNSEQAIKYAKDVIKVDRKSRTALQAKSIILEEAPASDDRDKALLKHEQLCRRKKAITPANNIAFDRVANATALSDDIASTLSKIAETSGEQRDFYSVTRAVVKKALLTVRAGQTLSSIEKTSVINAYQYLYNERLPSMFNDCTEALWGHFETTGETGNLFRLFRHSSLIWRLAGDDAREQKYLAKLSVYAQAIERDGERESSKERTYYEVRVSLLPNSGMRPAIQIGSAGETP